MISLRSGFVLDDVQEDYDVVDDVPSQKPVGRAFQPGADGSKDIVIRKSFPESFIFDGDLNLG